MLSKAVAPDDIADIIKLNCQRYTEASFCISLNTLEAASTVVDHRIWLEGIRVPSFYPRPKLDRKMMNIPVSNIRNRHVDIINKQYYIHISESAIRKLIKS